MAFKVGPWSVLASLSIIAMRLSVIIFVFVTVSVFLKLSMLLLFLQPLTNMICQA